MYSFNDKIHRHTLDGKDLTGTSSISDVLAKPLTWWASGLACAKFGWINPKLNPVEAVQKALGEAFEKIKGLTLSEYEKLVGEAYKAHSVKLKDSAKTGTDLHAQLENFVKSRMGLQAIDLYDPKIEPFIQWTDKEVKRFIASEAHCYDEDLFVGGIVDCVAELKDGTLAIIDFKSSKEAYPAQFMQCAGYAIQVEKNGLWSMDGKVSKKLEGKIGALIVVPFGAPVIEPIARIDVENCKEAFRNAVGLYRYLGLTKDN